MTSVYGAINYFLKVIVRNRTNSAVRDIVFTCKENSKLDEKIKKISALSKEVVLVDNTDYEGVKSLYMTIDTDKYLISDKIVSNWNGYILVELKQKDNEKLDLNIIYDYKDI